uniref:AnsB kinase n=1 Tax=Streptomyces collinus TaxID=42684 RepID=Q9X657_STRCU|nr:AnsB kinase [Streptomyces collinus]
MTAVPHHLGIDVGGTKAALRAALADGTVREAGFRVTVGPGPARHRRQRTWIRWLGKVREPCGGAPTALAGVSVAMPATLGAAGVVTAWPDRPGGTGTDLGSAPRGIFPTIRVAPAPTTATSPALAEAHTAGRPDPLYPGSGGGGLVVGRVPCPGLGRRTLEIGHVIVEMGGLRCVCGRRACLQGLASGRATHRRACLLGGAVVSYYGLERPLPNRVPWAADAQEGRTGALAAAVTGVEGLLRPDGLLIGGGYAAGFPEFVPSVLGFLPELVRQGQAPLPMGASAHCRKRWGRAGRR